MAPRVPGASLQIGVDRFMRVAVPVKLPQLRFTDTNVRRPAFSEPQISEYQGCSAA